MKIEAESEKKTAVPLQIYFSGHKILRLQASFGQREGYLIAITTLPQHS